MLWCASVTYECSKKTSRGFESVALHVKGVTSLFSKSCLFITFWGELHLLNSTTAAAASMSKRHYKVARLLTFTWKRAVCFKRIVTPAEGKGRCFSRQAWWVCALVCVGLLCVCPWSGRVRHVLSSAGSGPGYGTVFSVVLMRTLQRSDAGCKSPSLPLSPPFSFLSAFGPYLDVRGDKRQDSLWCFSFPAQHM